MTEILLAPMGVLAPGSVWSWPSANWRQLNFFAACVRVEEGKLGYSNWICAIFMKAPRTRACQFWSEQSALDQRSNLGRPIFFLLVDDIVQSPRRGCYRVPKFCPWVLKLNIWLLRGLGNPQNHNLGEDAWRWLCRHMRRKISTHVDGGPSRGSSTLLDILQLRLISAQSS